MATTLTGESTPAEMRAHISDTLAQLAEIAHRLGDRRLETSMRLLSLEVEVRTAPSAEAGERD